MVLHIGRYDTSHPGDTSDLKRKLEKIDPKRIERLALLTKTEGHADKNDFSRHYALLSAELFLKEYGGLDLLDRCSLLFSTGSEGAITPFGYYFVRTDEEDTAPSLSERPQLVMGVARSRRIRDEEVGTMDHVRLVSDAVTSALEDAGLNRDEVSFVIVKNPVMAIPEAAEGRDKPDSIISASHSKGVGGIGAGLALGEIDPSQVPTVDVISKDHSIHAKRVIAFSGAEVDYVDVIAFGNRRGVNSGLIAYSGQVRDLLDGKSIRRVLMQAGCKLDEYCDVADPDQVVAFFLKIGIAPDGRLRGSRTTIRTSHVDMDFPIRATASGMAHSILGTTRTFISADTVHQSPPGGGLCGCIVRIVN